MFPTIEESEESGCEICGSGQVEEQDGTTNDGTSSNSLSPYNTGGPVTGYGEHKCVHFRHNKDLGPLPKQKPPFGTQLTVPSHLGIEEIYSLSCREENLIYSSTN